MTQAITEVIERSEASTPTVLRSSATIPAAIRTAASISPAIQVEASMPVVMRSVARAGVENGTYMHTQTTPSSAWVVFHELNTKPVIEVIVNAEQQEARVTYPNLDSALIEFNSPAAGYAKCVG